MTQLDDQNIFAILTIQLYYPRDHNGVGTANEMIPLASLSPENDETALVSPNKL